MAAAQAGHLDVVEALIQAGARFGHKLSSIVIICFCQIFCICGKIFGNHIFSLMPFTLPCSQTLILAGTNTERFLDVIFLCSDVILVTLPMIKCCQTCFNFTPILTTIFSSTFYVDGIFFSPQKTMWDGASALFLAAQNGHSRFATLMAILVIGLPADKMMTAALRNMLLN